MIKKLLMDGDKIFFLKELEESVGTYSIFMKKESPMLVTCSFDPKYSKDIQGYFDYCGIKPKTANVNKETKILTIELKSKYVDFHLENLEDWFVEEKIIVEENMKLVE